MYFKRENKMEGGTGEIRRRTVRSDSAQGQTTGGVKGIVVQAMRYFCTLHQEDSLLVHKLTTRGEGGGGGREERGKAGEERGREQCGGSSGRIKDTF